MGINGLLKALSPILVPVNEVNNELNNLSRKSSSSSSPKYNIRQFSGKSIAVDVSSWLYKGLYSCAERFVESMEEHRIDEECEQRLCNYITKRCDELLKDVSINRIYLVFDGERCPLKAATNKKREMDRQENLKEARRLMQIGDTSKASDKYSHLFSSMHFFLITVFLFSSMHFFADTGSSRRSTSTYVHFSNLKLFRLVSCPSS